MRADIQTDQYKKMKSFSEKPFISFGGKTKFCRNSKSSSCSRRTQKSFCLNLVFLPKNHRFLKPTICLSTLLTQKPSFYASNMHYLPRNGSNSREVSRTIKNIQRQSSQIQEIVHGSSKSRNKSNHSNRKVKMSLNILTV